jgi:branched-chain amino acid transport system permease protein
LVFFGAAPKSILGYYPDQPPIFIFSASISADRAFAAAIGAITLMCLGSMLAWTKIGRAMRAVAQDEVGARLIGISVSRIRTITFSLSCGLAGLAGAVLLFLFPSSPFVGEMPLYLAWTVVVLAGLGNVAGTVVAGIAIALINNNTSYLIGPSWTSVIPFALMVVLLLVRPAGLFGKAIAGVWEK